jgi:hypothetical protein
LSVRSRSPHRCCKDDITVAFPKALSSSYRTPPGWHLSQLPFPTCL